MSNLLKTAAAASMAVGTFNVLSSIATDDSKKKISHLYYTIDLPKDVDLSSTLLQPFFMIHGW